MLEEKLENAYAIKSNGENKDLVETINAKDQYIVKLEKDLKTFQTEADTNVNIFYLLCKLFYLFIFNLL